MAPKTIIRYVDQEKQDKIHLSLWSFPKVTTDEQISLLTVAQIFRKNTAELFRLPKFKDFFTGRQYCTGWISQSRDISQKRRLTGLLSRHSDRCQSSASPGL